MRRNASRTALTFLAACAAATVVAACGGDDESSSPGAQAKSIKGCDAIDLSKAPAQPVKMRIAGGFAVDEPMDLLAADPKLAQHNGKWYKLDYKTLSGNSERFNAFQAGQLDGFETAPPSIIKAVARGIPVKIVAAVAREQQGGFLTTYSALEGKGIDSVDDLKGKKIAILDIGSSVDLLAKAAVKKGGFDPRTGASYVVMPFPAQEEALRKGQIDVATLVEPFYHLAHDKGGIVDVFNSLDVIPYPQENQQLLFGEKFIREHTGAVCAYLDDLKRATAFYNSSKDEAKRLLVDKKLVQSPLPLYLESKDYVHPEGNGVLVSSLGRIIASMKQLGFLTKGDSVKVEDLVVPGVTLTEQDQG